MVVVLNQCFKKRIPYWDHACAYFSYRLELEDFPPQAYSASDLCLLNGHLSASGAKASLLDCLALRGNVSALAILIFTAISVKPPQALESET